MRPNRLEQPWQYQAHNPSTLGAVLDSHSPRGEERMPSQEELFDRLKTGDIEALIALITGYNPEDIELIVPGRNIIGNLIRTIPGAIDMLGDDIIPRFFPEFENTEDLYAYIISQYDDLTRIETAEEGAVGLPGVDLELGNGFPGGHVPNCMYFAVLRFLGRSSEAPLPTAWVERWEAAAQGPIRSSDLIVPCWGPVIAVNNKFVYMGDDGFPRYDVRLRCNGLGIYPRIGGWFGTPRPWCWPYSLQAFEFTQRVRLDRPNFTLDGQTQGFTRPHEELWSWGPGERPERNGYTITPGIGVHWLWTGPPAMLVAVFEGGSVEPWTYSNGERGPYGFRCYLPPAPPPPGPTGGGGGGPPIRRRDEEEDVNCCSCEQITRIIDQRLKPIYQILGFPQVTEPKIVVEPEKWVEALGARIYANGRQNKVEVKSIQDALGTILAAHYMRSGLHRLPAKVPENLAVDGGTQVELVDVMAWNEWVVKQLDGLIGAYPMKISVQGPDEEDERQEIKIDNTADALKEILGLLTGIADSVDTAAQCSMRAMLEASKAGNAALIAQDYAKANAQYLGYQGGQVERTIKTSFSPEPTIVEQSASGGGSSSRRRNKKKNELLAPGTGAIVGFELQGQQSLEGTLNKILLGIGIIKAALVQPLDESVIGDDIRRKARTERTQNETEWSEFLADLRTPPANQRIQNAPDVEVRDVSRGSNNSNNNSGRSGS